MALYRVTVKRTGTTSGVRLEQGMSVEVSSQSDPLSLNGGIAIQDAFNRIYGIDIKKAGGLTRSVLDVTKIS